jgi:signal transduction histidine kinase
MSQPVHGAVRRRRIPIVTTRWRVRRWAVLLVVAEVVLLVGTITAGAIALNRLSEDRDRVVDQIDPELSEAQNLSNALLTQESGIGGYMLTGRRDFLAEYEQGRGRQDLAVAELRRRGAVAGTEAGADLDAVLSAASAWHGTVDPWTTVEPAANAVEIERGRDLFNGVRAALGTQRDHLNQARAMARDRLFDASSALRTMLLTIAILLVVLFALVYLTFQRTVVRPILGLADEVRTVSDVDLNHRVAISRGPRELVELSSDIEAMRQRILDEVSALHRAHQLLDARTKELERSNADLEQFAYVASHDLQEPLRKVASFCQLLQRRYQGRLDERGEKYIAFAVDGAKRMQVLINDLLTFSRVGRPAGESVIVDTGEVLAAAIGNLESAIDYTGAEITHGELPKVRGEASLLTAVFQNLINNAIKFRGEQPPRVRVEAERDGGEWVFSVSDNGIGISAEYAERVFVLFQRLHTRSAYPGTGIGLAMCRRIIEYHGGRIWLDTTATDGETRFSFTLPALPEPEESEDA